MAVEFITSESEHWYPSPTKPDVYYPSVTTVLSVFPKGVGFNKYLTAQPSWEDAQQTLKEAGKRGTNVHKATEMLESGAVLSRPSYTVQEWEMLCGFVAWYKETRPQILHMEFGIVSDKHKTGGTIDRVYVIDGIITLLDIKTSSSIHDNYWIQVAAYAQMFEEANKDTKIAQTAILRLTDRKKSRYEYQTRERSEWKKDFKTYQSTRAMWDYVNPTAKPKIIELPDTLSLAL